jgi:5'-methylthioadenosine phosphorylase
VVCDQLVDRTCGRPDTYFDGPVTHHVPFADPYCSELRAAALAAGAGSDLSTVDGGTVVVVQGPRFSTRAESRWFGANGWDVVNMTQHPEAVLARELGICYAGLALVTDYDVGVEGDRPPVSQEEVFNYFGENVHRLLGLLRAALPMVAEVASCHCAGGAGPFSALPRS